MTFERKSQGNTKGIQDTLRATDPLQRHIFMIPESMAKLLEKMVFESEEKTNKSKLVREAITQQYINS